MVGLLLLLALTGLLVVILRRAVDGETRKNLRFLGRIVLAMVGVLILVGLLLMSQL